VMGSMNNLKKVNSLELIQPVMTTQL